MDKGLKKIFYEGLIVKIVNLKGRADLNDQLGLTLSYDSKRERWGIEVISSGEKVLIRPINLLLHDRVFEAHHAENFGQEDLCHIYSAQLVNALSKSSQGSTQQSLNTCESLLATIDAITDPSLIQVCMNAASHHFILEILPQPKLRARMLQCAVDSFTSLQWMQSSSSKWMDRVALERFLQQMFNIKDMMMDILDTELLDCARARGKVTLEQQRAWAGYLLSPQVLNQDGITMMPYHVSNFDIYLQQGGNAMLEIYSRFESSDPNHLVSVPLKKAKPLFLLYEETFHSSISPFQIIRLLEYQRYSQAWVYSVFKMS